MDEFRGLDRHDLEAKAHQYAVTDKTVRGAWLQAVDKSLGNTHCIWHSRHIVDKILVDK